MVEQSHLDDSTAGAQGWAMVPLNQIVFNKRILNIQNTKNKGNTIEHISLGNLTESQGLNQQNNIDGMYKMDIIQVHKDGI